MYKKVNENGCILSDCKNGGVEDWGKKTREPDELECQLLNMDYTSF